MATPSPFCKKVAGKLGMLKTQLDDLSHGMLDLTNNIPDVGRVGTSDIERINEENNKNLNRILAVFHEIETLVRQSSSTVQDEFSLGLDVDNYVNGIKKEDMTIDTSLHNRAPRLCAKVGKKEALENLKRLPHNQKNKIQDYRLCQCFGFRGGEKHFVDFFKDFGEKTRGILAMTAPFYGYDWRDCWEFVNAYYDNYYLQQIRGELIADGASKTLKKVG